MNFGEQSRMSQLKDRNIYLETDKLYQPLRNALRKSTVSQSHHFSQLTNSRVGRNLRSLSPSEAETIKRNLMIPINKELVATRNIQKVLGKSFTAVDVSQTVKQPLTPEQFSRIRRDTAEEIVYQIRDESFRQSNIYTARQRTASPAFAPITPVAPVNLNLRQSKVVRFDQSSKKNQIKFIAQPTRPTQINIYTQSQVAPQVAPRNSILTMNPRQSTGFVAQNTRQSRISFGKSNYYVAPQLIMQRQNSSSSINRSMASIRATRNETKANDGILSETKMTKDQASNLYQFRSSKGSDKATRLSNGSKSRDQYKYNLGAFDESGGTGCQGGCCHNNQLFGSRMPYNPWK